MIVCRLTGGMANLIYIIAATIGYAKKHNIPYAIPTVTTNKRWKHYRFPGIRYEDIDTRNFFHYREPAIEYDKRPYDITFQDIPYHENIILEGHFLSHKYWWDYKDEILPLFGFEWHPIGNAISCHLRCGDYRNMQQYLPIMPIEYYQRAVKIAVGLTGIKNMVVFGDEPQYNRDIFTLDKFPELDRIAFSENETELKDFELMSCFPVNITGNSTFSQMANHFNQHTNKICISPLKWHGPAYGKVDTKDMHVPNVILV